MKDYLEGLFAAMSAASAVQCTRDLHYYLQYLQGLSVTTPKEAVGESNKSPDKGEASGIHHSSMVAAAVSNLESKYACLLSNIAQMRECIACACARSRYSTERLKRLINRARNLVRECLMELDTLGHQWAS